jgi:hypothetical protein
MNFELAFRLTELAAGVRAYPLLDLSDSLLGTPAVSVGYEPPRAFGDIPAQ